MVGFGVIEGRVTSKKALRWSQRRQCAVAKE
jgi:hypothetical protein